MIPRLGTPPRLLPITQFYFSSFANPRLSQRGQLPLSGSTSGAKRACLQWKWVPSGNTGSRHQPLNLPRLLCAVLAAEVCFVTPMPSAVITSTLDARPLPLHSFQDPVVFCILCRTCSHHPTVSKTLSDNCFLSVAPIHHGLTQPSAALLGLQGRGKAQQTRSGFTVKALLDTRDASL